MDELLLIPISLPSLEMSSDGTITANSGWVVGHIRPGLLGLYGFKPGTEHILLTERILTDLARVLDMVNN